MPKLKKKKKKKAYYLANTQKASSGAKFAKVSD